MRISDWSSDVCSSDLGGAVALARDAVAGDAPQQSADNRAADGVAMAAAADHVGIVARVISAAIGAVVIGIIRRRRIVDAGARSEEHTSELQSLMRISYAVFCLKKKKQHKQSNKSTTYKEL